MARAQLVARIVHRSNLLQSWENPETGGVRASGAYGPTNAAITGIPASYAATEAHHCSEGTALACRDDHTPWPMRDASA